MRTDSPRGVCRHPEVTRSAASGRSRWRTSRLTFAALVLTAFLPGRAAAQFGLGVNLDDLIVERGQVVTASISISKFGTDPAALYGAGFKLRFDDMALEVVDVQLAPGITGPGMLHFENVVPLGGVVAISFTRTFGSGFTTGLDVGLVHFRIRATAPAGLGTVWFEDYTGVSSDGSTVLSSAADFSYIVFGAPLGVEPPLRNPTVSLGPVTPNPAGRTIRSTLALPTSARIELSILDIRGGAVGQSVRQDLPAGTHTLAMDCSGQPPGVYLLVCRVNGTIHRRAFTRL